MPFKKIGKNKYKSPKSGKIFTLKQIQAYILNKIKGPRR